MNHSLAVAPTPRPLLAEAASLNFSNSEIDFLTWMLDEAGKKPRLSHWEFLEKADLLMPRESETFPTRMKRFIELAMDAKQEKGTQSLEALSTGEVSHG